MSRPAAKDVAVKSALAQLWCLDEFCDETYKLEGSKAALACWLRAAYDCKRWIAVVAAAGRGGDLPLYLLRNKAFFNARDWRIP